MTVSTFQFSIICDIIFMFYFSRFNVLCLSDDLCTNSFHKLTWFLHNWRSRDKKKFSSLADILYTDDNLNGSVWYLFFVHLHCFFKMGYSLKFFPDITSHPMDKFRIPDEYFDEDMIIKVDLHLKKYTVMNMDEVEFSIPIKIPCE